MHIITDFINIHAYNQTNKQKYIHIYIDILFKSHICVMHTYIRTYIHKDYSYHGQACMCATAKVSLSRLTSPRTKSPSKLERPPRFTLEAYCRSLNNCNYIHILSLLLSLLLLLYIHKYKYVCITTNGNCSGDPTRSPRFEDAQRQQRDIRRIHGAHVDGAHGGYIYIFIFFSQKKKKVISTFDSFLTLT